MESDFFFEQGLTKNQRLQKRAFDIFFSIPAIIILFFPILILVFLASFSTGKFGLFKQTRIGQFGNKFGMLKIRTMKNGLDNKEFVTIKGDPRITKFGNFLRSFKLDELPQIFNVIGGQMSLVGPRPDVSGFADVLVGYDRIILSVKPGITGPASIHYRYEEELLMEKIDPIKYNNEIIWPNKVRINIQYLENWSLWNDVRYILKTIF